MTRTVHHLLGSSYARNVAPLLRQFRPEYRWVGVTEAQEVAPNSTVLLSPTPDDNATQFLRQLPHGHRVVLLLDYNHLGFDDVQRLLELRKISWALSPFAIPGIRTRRYPGLSLIESRSWGIAPVSNLSEVIFVSQPLREDGRTGYDQFELLREMLTLGAREGKTVFLKRHPRETEPLPADLAAHPRLVLWREDLRAAYEHFQHWYGLNSLPLYVARDLGREVKVWDRLSASFLPMPSLQSIVE